VLTHVARAGLLKRLTLFESPFQPTILCDEMRRRERERERERRGRKLARKIVSVFRGRKSLLKPDIARIMGSVFLQQHFAGLYIWEKVIKGGYRVCVPYHEEVLVVQMRARDEEEDSFV